MDFVIAALALVLGLCALTGGLAYARTRRARHISRGRARAGELAQWRVEEVTRIHLSRSRSTGPGSATQVVICRRTEDGEDVGRIIVASIPDDDPEWAERMLEARAAAAARADLLNARP